MITWPKHRTHIGRTLEYADKMPSIEKIVQSGLDIHRGTVPILEDIISWLIRERFDTLRAIKAIRKDLQQVRDSMEKKQ
jgi:hypothetical protein